MLLARVMRRLAGSLRRRPAEDVQAHGQDALRRADIALVAGRLDGALADYREALRVAPDDGEATLGVGIVLARLGEHRSAREHLLRATTLLGERPDLLSALGQVEHALGELDAALAWFERALRAGPGSARVRLSLARVERERGEPARALAWAREATERAPTLADAWLELGLARSDLADGTARDAIEHAITVDPSSARARLARGFERLLDGDYADGWRDYEARLDVDPWEGWARIPAPRWSGEDLSGRRLLVIGDQGVGDQIMFASCVPDLIARGAQVTLVVDPRLVTLFSRSFPGATVLADGPHLPLPAADLHVPLASLPLHMRRRSTDFPPRDHYLVPDSAIVAAFRQRLPARQDRPVIGIAWRGGLPQTRRRLRSIDPVRLASVLLEHCDAELVVLQHDATEAELAGLTQMAGARLHHWREAHDAFDQAAGLVAALDGVLTVCSTVVHLAGALGMRTAVLVPSAPEWRYGRGAASMPWYRSVRLFRQRAPGAWLPALGGAVDHVAGQQRSA